MVFVAGEPALFLTSGERLWKKAVAAAALPPLAHPALHFTVATFRRRGQPFDLDNLAKPVIECLGGRPTTVWVTIQEGTRSGVEIADELPPPAPGDAMAVVVGSPRSRSVFPTVPMAEFASLDRFGQPQEPLGLQIMFDSETARISDFGFSGPIKPFIDGMETVLGPSSHGPADHRIRELRITKGNNPGGFGATVRIWLRSNDEARF